MFLLVRCDTIAGMEDDYITTAEAAKELVVTPARVRVLIREGRLKAKTIGEGNRSTHLILRADLEAVRERKPGRPPKPKAATKTAKKKPRGRPKKDQP